MFLSRTVVLRYFHVNSTVQSIVCRHVSCPFGKIKASRRRGHAARNRATSGGFERHVMRALASAELPIVAVNPRQVRDFAKATGQLAKTDRIDAMILARFAEAVRPSVRPSGTCLGTRTGGRRSRINGFLLLMAMLSQVTAVSKRTRFNSRALIVTVTVDALIASAAHSGRNSTPSEG